MNEKKAPLPPREEAPAKEPTSKRTSVILPIAYVDAMQTIWDETLISPSILMRLGLREVFKNYPELINKDNAVWKA